VLPIITDAWEGWKHNEWGVLPIIEMLKEMEIQWMEQPYQFQEVLCRWRVLPIAFAHVIQ
jgi:L-alanine-DL-glutamate epimerase-like enolase superfamily enzyme